MLMDFISTSFCHALYGNCRVVFHHTEISLFALHYVPNSTFSLFSMSVLQVCQAMVHFAEFPSFRQAIAEDGFYEEVSDCSVVCRCVLCCDVICCAVLRCVL
jgi:hypothetical protein